MRRTNQQRLPHTATTNCCLTSLQDSSDYHQFPPWVHLLTHAGVIPEYGDLDSLRTSLTLGWRNTDQSGVSYLGSQRADAKSFR